MRALNFLIWAMTLTIVAMAVGMIAPAVVGSDESPSFEPVIAGLTKLVRWATLAGEAANTPEENPEPFLEVVQDSAAEVRDRIDEQREAFGEGPAMQYQEGPMLSVCDQRTERSVDDTVMVSLADGLRAAWDDGQRFSVPELQQRMGQPHCTYRDGRGRRWLINSPLAAIDAFGTEEPNLTFVNF